MADIRREPYAEWLEGMLREMVGLHPTSILIATINEDDSTGTAYFNTGIEDRWLMVGSILLDLLVNWMRRNADTIQEILDGEEDNDADP